MMSIWFDALMANAFIERDVAASTTAFSRCTFPRVIDEDPTHELRGDTKEMRAVLPSNVTLIDQFEERLVNQSRRLSGMLGPFTPEITRRHSAQFSIDDWHQGVECFAVATGPARKQFRNVAVRRCFHRSGGPA
jgi:hypothetical protein